MITDSEGHFQIRDIPATLVPPGVYDLRIRGESTLSSLDSGVAIPSGSSPSVTTVSPERLRQGDIDANNLVDDLDLEALKASFGKLEIDDGYNPIADFNRDKVIDGQDFSRLAQNFGARGE